MDARQNRGRTDLPAPSLLRNLKSRLFLPLVILTEVLGVGAVVLVGVWTGEGFRWDSMGKIYIHPFVLTLGMVFLFGNGTLLYRIGGRISVRRKVLKVAHAMVMVVVIVCTALGFYLAVTSVIGRSFDSVHAVLGIVTTVLFVLEFLCGVFFFVLPCAPGWMRASYLELHAFFGIVTLVSAAATCLTGIQAGEHMYGRWEAIYVSAALCITAFTVVVVYILSTDVYKPKKNLQIN